jgi:hypothetical protein
MAQALAVEPEQVFNSPSKTPTDAHFLFFSGLTGTDFFAVPRR